MDLLSEEQVLLLNVVDKQVPVLGPYGYSVAFGLQGQIG